MAVKTNLSLEEAVKQYEELIAIPGVVETAFRRELAKADIEANEEFMRQSGIAEGKAQGIITGMIKGRSEGKAEGIKKTILATKMLIKKCDIQEIVKSTGLSKEEIKELAESI